MNAFPWKPRRSDNSPYSAHVVLAVALSTLLVPLMMRSRVVCLSMQTDGVTAEQNQSQYFTETGALRFLER